MLYTIEGTLTIRSIVPKVSPGLSSCAIFCAVRYAPWSRRCHTWLS